MKVESFAKHFVKSPANFLTYKTCFYVKVLWDHNQTIKKKKFIQLLCFIRLGS